jgi:hypothetical protein
LEHAISSHGNIGLLGLAKRISYQWRITRFYAILGTAGTERIVVSYFLRNEVEGWGSHRHYRSMATYFGNSDCFLSGFRMGWGASYSLLNMGQYRLVLELWSLVIESVSK